MKTSSAVELMWAMAARARELAGRSINELRLAVGTADTPSAAIAESRHKDRGQLIEEILSEEFEDQAKAIDEQEVCP